MAESCCCTVRDCAGRRVSLLYQTDSREVFQIVATLPEIPDLKVGFLESTERCGGDVLGPVAFCYGVAGCVDFEGRRVVTRQRVYFSKKEYNDTIVIIERRGSRVEIVDGDGPSHPLLGPNEAYRASLAAPSGGPQARPKVHESQLPCSA